LRGKQPTGSRRKAGWKSQSFRPPTLIDLKAGSNVYGLH
jgi:hypothetical protein